MFSHSFHIGESKSPEQYCSHSLRLTLSWQNWREKIYFLKHQNSILIWQHLYTSFLHISPTCTCWWLYFGTANSLKSNTPFFTLLHLIDYIFLSTSHSQLKKSLWLKVPYSRSFCGIFLFELPSHEHVGLLSIAGLSSYSWKLSDFHITSFAVEPQIYLKSVYFLQPILLPPTPLSPTPSLILPLLTLPYSHIPTPLPQLQLLPYPPPPQHVYSPFNMFRSGGLCFSSCLHQSNNTILSLKHISTLKP